MTQQNDFSHIRLLVFDIDGTLAETDDYYVEIAGKITHYILFLFNPVRAYKFGRGIVMGGETILNFFIMALDKLHLGFITEKLHNKMAAGKQKYRYAPIDQAIEVIRSLAVHYQLAIITAGGEKSTQAFLDAYSLRDCFCSVVSGQTCSHSKPSPIPLQYTMEQTEMTPEQTLMIGDTFFDILTAKRAGVGCIAVRSGFDSEWFLKLFHPEYIIDSVALLPQLLTTSENPKFQVL